MLLYQPQSGYCYNSDSIYLYDFISSFNPRGRMLDVGAGCGVVGCEVCGVPGVVAAAGVVCLDEAWYGAVQG